LSTIAQAEPCRKWFLQKMQPIQPGGVSAPLSVLAFARHRARFGALNSVKAKARSLAGLHRQ
jgi:hypothetical protein